MKNPDVHARLKRVFRTHRYYQEWLEQREDFLSLIDSPKHIDNVAIAYDLNWLRWLHATHLYPGDYEDIVASTWMEGHANHYIRTTHKLDQIIASLPPFDDFANNSMITGGYTLDDHGVISIWNDPIVGSYHHYVSDSGRRVLCYGPTFDLTALEKLGQTSTRGIN